MKQKHLLFSQENLVNDEIIPQVKLLQVSFSLAEFSIGTYQGLVPDLPPFNTKAHTCPNALCKMEP